MGHFEHVRHKPPLQLAQRRQLVVACPPLRSNINLSRIVRMAGCCAVERVIACGTAKVIDRIARDGASQVQVEVHRTLPPVLQKLRGEDFQLIGLEQATGSVSLHDFSFQRRTVLVVGNERHGIGDDVLALLHGVVEIPVWGMPYSYNVATAACLAMYEYCRQFPQG